MCVLYGLKKRLRGRCWILRPSQTEIPMLISSWVGLPTEMHRLWKNPCCEMRIVWFFPSYITASTGYSYSTLLEMSRAELWLVNQHFSLLALKCASRFQWLTIYSLVKACELQKLILLSWTRKVFWIPNWLNQNLCLINLKHFIFQFSPPSWLSTVHKCVKMSQLSCLSWHICF